MNNWLRVAAWLVAVVIVIVIVAVLALGGRRLLSNSTGEEETVVQATPSPVVRGETQPRDASAPAQTETATFALG